MMRRLKDFISGYVTKMKKIHEEHNKGFTKEEVDVQPMPFPTLTVIEGGLSGSKYIKNRLSELEEEIAMEKHGVEKDEEKTKIASTAEGKCPSCGNELTKEGDTHIDHCPQCGTQPFEKKPEAQ